MVMWFSVRTRSRVSMSSMCGTGLKERVASGVSTSANCSRVVERRAALREHAPAHGQRVMHATNVGVDHVIRHGPCAAVDDENRISRQEVSPESAIRIDRIAGGGVLSSQSGTEGRNSNLT